MRKAFLVLNVLGILLQLNGTSGTRPTIELKKEEPPIQGDARKYRRNEQETLNKEGEKEGVVKRDLGLLNEPEDDDFVDGRRWTREGELGPWIRQERLNPLSSRRERLNSLSSRQDDILARQEDFDRWLRKRGSCTVDQDPEAMRVASKQSELQELLQLIFEAQAAVKMETAEVTRTQQIAQEAQSALEDSTNKVRMLSADLQVAQEGAAAAAMRAHTAQLQLSAHDQLMFTARQRVDALSARMVSVQAELAAAQQIFTLTNSSHLLEEQGRIGYDSLFGQQPMGMSPQVGFNMQNIGLGQQPLGPSQRGIGPQGLAMKLNQRSIPSDERPNDGLSAIPYLSRPNYNFIYHQ